MPRVAYTYLLVVAVIVAGAGCNPILDPDPVADADAGSDATETHDQGSPPPTMRVAAIQWDLAKDYDQIGILDMIKKAATGGAELVVTPSRVAKVLNSEPKPSVGDKPLAADSAWKAGSTMHTMAKAAVDNKITLVFSQPTVDNTTSPETYYQTVVAIDKDGEVVARHDQFAGGFPPAWTAGTSLATSFFVYRESKVGLMWEADADCSNMSIATTGCTQHHVDMLKKYRDEKPRIILLSTTHIGAQGGYGEYPNYGFLVANAFGAWLVVGNQRWEPYGHGGGIFKPDGSTLAFDKADKGPVVVFGDIPLPSK